MQQGCGNKLQKTSTKLISGSIFLVLLKAIVFTSAIASTTHHISGAVILPEPNNSGSELGFNLNLCSNGGSLNPSGCLYGAVVIIPPGFTSGGYSIEVSSALVTQWDLSYYCWSCAPPLLRQGYYDGVGSTTWDESDRTLLASGQDHININITPEIGNVISGDIEVPQEVNMVSDYLLIDIYTKTESIPYVDCCIRNSISIERDSKRTSYSIAVPPTAALIWHVEYKCYFGKICENNVVHSSGYYSANSTTQNFSARSLLSGGMNHQNINFSLFPIEKVDTTSLSIVAPILLLLDE